MNSKYPEWSGLCGRHHDFLAPVINRWKRLLRSDKTREQTLHCFLAKHAQLFLRNGSGFATVISKLRLGAEFVADFVSVYDNWSEGIRYSLIEIELPQTAPFTKDGVASARLSRAIQQVLSWKSWLAEHTTEARRLFPSLFHRTATRP